MNNICCVSSRVITCHHVSSCVIIHVTICHRTCHHTCHHVSSRVMTCHHVASRVITCHHYMSSCVLQSVVSCQSTFPVTIYPKLTRLDLLIAGSWNSSLDVDAMTPEWQEGWFRNSTIRDPGVCRVYICICSSINKFDLHPQKISIYIYIKL